MKLYFTLAASLAFSALAQPAYAHRWHKHGDDGEHHPHTHSSPRKDNKDQIKSDTQGDAATKQPPFVLVAFQPKEEEIVTGENDIVRHFAHFKNVKTRIDAQTLYIESNGLPDHNMMVGIRSWQQQVPLPQPFTGKNAWQIPLHPKLADKPISAKNNLFRGAIALAVNGVPIFNALNNRGEDAFLAGELDEWGGHCGRGDDYHYHAAPVHLEKIVGKGNPIAFALDGFPIYGLTEADGSPVGKLDEYNGQFDSDGNYHYHATKTYPYINGGMRGVVTVRGGQIEPQPRDMPVRPALQPLRGATITAFESTQTKSVLTYKVGGKIGTVTYMPVGDNGWKFTYAEPGDRTRTESYERRAGPEQRGGGRQPPPPRDNNPPRRRP